MLDGGQQLPVGGPRLWRVAGHLTVEMAQHVAPGVVAAEVARRADAASSGQVVEVVRHRRALRLRWAMRRGPHGHYAHGHDTAWLGHLRALRTGVGTHAQVVHGVILTAVQGVSMLLTGRPQLQAGTEGS